MIFIDDIITHLSNNIKTEIGVSDINGVGVFAIKDINKGEEIFPIWENESGIYAIPAERLNEIPNSVLKQLDKYFINDVNNSGYKIIRLFNGLNFLYHGTSFCNSSYPNKENTNMSINGIATRDIKEGEEILEWYTENINLVESK